MALTIRLLGPPRVARGDQAAYPFRSRKSWALLAYLLLTGRAASRARLAALLFEEADDPLRALRWNLAEIRRCLGEDGSIEGDPVRLVLAEGSVVDVDVVTSGSWPDAVRLPTLGEDLLDGVAFPGAAAFESWLLSERHRLAAASESVLHEAALGHLSTGDLDGAVAYAARSAAMNPLDENHQALLIRLYRLRGANEAAEQQFRRYASLLDTELGLAPGVAVTAALAEQRYDRAETADAASVAAVIEAGAAAVHAGALEQGMRSLRTASRLADESHLVALRVASRLEMAEALVHALGGLDEEGLAVLTEADRIALDHDDRESVARARAEIGYVDFLRARYDRAEVWLRDALTFADGSLVVRAKATIYLGGVASDRGDYDGAFTLLQQGVGLADSAGDHRREAWARSLLGRCHLLRGELAPAAGHLRVAIAGAERVGWLAFLPWPQALLGEVHLLLGEDETASTTLSQAFARACQLGDPCWEGTAARGLALLAEERGDTDLAFATLADARVRANRLADPYVWLDAYILDALCELGRRHRHPETREWQRSLSELASRTGMRELVARSMLHGAALGHEGDADAAALVAADIDNPQLQRLVSDSGVGRW